MVRTLLMLYLAVLFVSATALADSNSSFDNQGGTLHSFKDGHKGYYLQMGNPKTGLGGSALTSVTGAGALNCGGQLPACKGNVSWKTPDTASLTKTLINNVTSGPTSLGGGGSFTIFEKGGTHGGIVFTGTFTTATWTYVGTCTGFPACGVSGGYYAWQLSGNITGTLYANGQQYQVSGATVQLTTQKFKKDPFINGTGSMTLSGGNTTLPGVAPEPGTLALLGSGLVGIGFFARRKYSSRLARLQS
jgi:hypothetical protein